MFSNVAALKKIAVGTRLRLVNCLMGPCDKLRIVAKVNSNSIQFTGDGIQEGRTSYLYFPKSSQFRADDNGFTIFEDNEIAAQYIFDTNV